MKKTAILLSLTVMAIIIVVSLMDNNLKVKESITFFPLNEFIQYTLAETSLSLDTEKPSEQYSLNWRISSALEQDAYLRQDIGLLFRNGRLLNKLGEWEQNTDQVVQEEEIQSKESGKYEAISFHHSEIHQNENEISSSQKMSSDFLYVIDSNFSPLSSFKDPSTKAEKEWKEILDQITLQQLEYKWDKAFKAFSINEEIYNKFLLTEFNKFDSTPLPGFSQEQTNQIVGRLWEGVYKNYFLGIKKRDGSLVDSLGSSIPLVLIAKDQSELLIVTETADGESIMLKQFIPERN